MDFIEEAQKQRFSKVEHLAPRAGILLRPVLLHVFCGMLQKGVLEAYKKPCVSGMGWGVAHLC